MTWPDNLASQHGRGSEPRLQNRSGIRFLSTLVVSLAFTFAGSSTAFAQTVVDATTVVIGQCLGHEKEPACVLPSVYGPNGLTLNPTIPHFAHFLGDAQKILNQSLSTSIATQLATLPISSPASGFTYRYDSASSAFVRTTDSFGPIYAERSELIGRGKFSFGASYQRFRFGSLDGIDLQSVPAVFEHVEPATGVTLQPYHADVISTTDNIGLHLDQTMFYGTVGLTNRFDVSVSVPIVSVRMSVGSNANIIRVGGDCYTPNGPLTGTQGTCPAGQLQDPHSFSDGTLSHTFNNSGSATGIGDITLRFKSTLMQSDKIRVAAALDLRTPTGDERKYLGAGAMGIKPFVAITWPKRFSPHVNVGYQWNGQSILAGDVTGAVIGENSSGQVTITNGDPIKDNLPSQLFYTVGLDGGITKKLTIAFDYLGQTLFSAPRVTASTLTTETIAGSTGTACPAKGGCTLPTISGVKESFTLNNGAIGLKYNLFGNLLLIGDILFRMDSHGLRQDITPLIALSYSSGH
jgi:hypothetical protein